MNRKEEVYQVLNDLNIEYQILNHSAVFTIDEMNKLSMEQYGDICKNLFLRDAKGERYFIVVLRKDKRVDLKAIQQQLGCTRLSFASEERLYKYLLLNKGEVTPLGIINDSEHLVEVVIDNDLIGVNKLGVHPNDNTATIWISYEDLIKFTKQNGNTIHLVDI